MNTPAKQRETPMSTDEQSQMVDDISSIIMRGRYGRSGVGRPSDNPLDLRDARRIVEYVMARDARVRRDALTALADHWDETVSEHAGRPLFSASGAHVRHYRDTHYPEPFTWTKAEDARRLQAIADGAADHYPEETP